jgi:hypothetical protein
MVLKVRASSPTSSRERTWTLREKSPRARSLAALERDSTGARILLDKKKVRTRAAPAAERPLHTRNLLMEGRLLSWDAPIGSSGRGLRIDEQGAQIAP